MASVLIVQVLQKGPCGANPQIAYTDVGSADKLSEQGLGEEVKRWEATTVKDWVWVLRHTTPLTHTHFFLIVCAVGGCLVRALKH
jgi:hypothetical protein